MKRICLLIPLVFIFACSKSKSVDNKEVTVPTEKYEAAEVPEILDTSVPNVCENLPEEFFNEYPIKDQEGKLVNGVCRFIDEDSVTEFNLKDGKQIGNIKIYNMNGQLVTEWKTNADGYIQYSTKYYDENGVEVKGELSYIDNLTYYNGELFTGTKKQYYPDNTTVFIETGLIKGEPSLVGRAYHIDGTPWYDLDFSKEDISDQIRPIK